MSTNSIKEILTLHVSVKGCDGWSGLLPEPNTSGTDGPLASLAQARDRIRSMRKSGTLRGPVDVLVHGGLYKIADTLKFTTEDLGDVTTPVTFKAAGDGEARLVGGISLGSFTTHEGPIMKLDLDASGYKGINFRQLFFR